MNFELLSKILFSYYSINHQNGINYRLMNIDCMNKYKINE